MTTKVDIAGTYTFHGQRLTNPDQPFFLRFESGGKAISGLSYTSPTGFFRYLCIAKTDILAYRLDGEQLQRGTGGFGLFPYTDRNTCRFNWLIPNPDPKPYTYKAGRFTRVEPDDTLHVQYELKASNDDTGRLVITIQPWPDPTEPRPNPAHPTESPCPSRPIYPPKPALTQTTEHSEAK